MPIGSCPGRLHRVSTAVRKFTHDISDIFNAAAAIFTAFLRLLLFAFRFKLTTLPKNMGAWKRTTSRFRMQLR